MSQRKPKRSHPTTPNATLTSRKTLERAWNNAIPRALEFAKKATEKARDLIQKIADARKDAPAKGQGPQMMAMRARAAKMASGRRHGSRTKVA